MHDITQEARKNVRFSCYVTIDTEIWVRVWTKVRKETKVKQWPANMKCSWKSHSTPINYNATHIFMTHSWPIQENKKGDTKLTYFHNYFIHSLLLLLPWFRNVLITSKPEMKYVAHNYSRKRICFYF